MGDVRALMFHDWTVLRRSGMFWGTTVGYAVFIAVTQAGLGMVFPTYGPMLVSFGAPWFGYAVVTAALGAQGVRRMDDHAERLDAVYALTGRPMWRYAIGRAAFYLAAEAVFLAVDVAWLAWAGMIDGSASAIAAVANGCAGGLVMVFCGIEMVLMSGGGGTAAMSVMTLLSCVPMLAIMALNGAPDMVGWPWWTASAGDLAIVVAALAGTAIAIRRRYAVTLRAASAIGR